MNVAELATTAHDLVSEWMDAFEVPNDLELQRELIEEENAELLEALKAMANDMSVENVAHYLKEYGDVVFVTAGYHVMQIRGAVTDHPQRIQHTLIGAKLIAGTLVVLEDAIFGAPQPEIRYEAFRRVCASNMTKLVDGVPLRNEAGKVLKGPNYQPPYLDDLAERLLNIQPELALAA